MLASGAAAATSALAPGASLKKPASKRQGAGVPLFRMFY
jgi:hypothetical protein